MKSEDIFFQNLNNIDYIQQIVNSCIEIWKDSVSCLKHISIIQEYKKNEYLDRKQAIDIYKKFNIENEDYLCIGINFYRLLIPNTYYVEIEQLPNELIICNLYLQLLYFYPNRTIKYFEKYY